MKASKRLIVSTIVMVSSCCGPAAHAGIPVIDGANLVQSIMNILSWAEQYQQMYQDYEQQIRNYQALTGARNLGDILNNPAFRNTVDPNFINTMQSIQNSGSSGLSAQARTLRKTLELYDCSDRSGTDRRTCEASLNVNSQNMANQQNALSLLTQRINQIQGLQSRINSTDDPKAIAELQARIAAEQTQIANDANRIAVMNAYTAAQERSIEQQLKEEEMRNLSLSSDGTDTLAPY